MQNLRLLYWYIGMVTTLLFLLHHLYTIVTFSQAV